MLDKINENKIKVETYGLADFLKLVEPLLGEGYSFDFEDNDAYPQSYGSFYSCILVKKEEVKEVESQEDISEGEEKKKVGRKPKA